MYGKVCACCGFDDIRFLSVDHVNNDGKRDRAGRRQNHKNLLKFRRNRVACDDLAKSNMAARVLIKS